MGKGIHDYVKASLSRLKKRRISGDRITGATWLLTACSYPRTPSFAAISRHESKAETSTAHAPRLSPTSTASSSRTSNSLCADAGDHVETEGLGSMGSPDYPDNPPVILRSSDRFFVDPGLSRRPGPPSDAGGVGVLEESVAVMTLSKDPFEDFRQSMLEMVEARHADNDPSQKSDWDFMEELLFCYLELNDRTVHCYILGAFRVLMVSLRPQSGKQNLTEIRRHSSAGDLGCGPHAMNGGEGGG